MLYRKQSKSTILVELFLICGVLVTLVYSQVVNPRCLRLEAYSVSPKIMQQAYKVVAKRLELLDIKGVNLFPLQGKYIEISLQDVANEAYEKLLESLQVKGHLTFRLVKPNSESKKANNLVIEDLEEVIFTSDVFAFVGPDVDYMGNAVLLFDIKKSYQDDFMNFTSSHIGQRLAIVLDDRVLFAPMLQGTISESGQISGLNDLDVEVVTTALLSGALPVHFQISAVDSVSGCSVKP